MKKSFKIVSVNFSSDRNFCIVHIQTKDNTYNLFISLETGEITNYEKVEDFIDKSEIYFAIYSYINKLKNEIDLVIKSSAFISYVDRLKFLRKQIGEKHFMTYLYAMGYEVKNKRRKKDE